MFLKGEGVTADALYHWLTSVSGAIELVVVVACVWVSKYGASWVFERYFTSRPQRYTEFWPYIGYRLLFPVLSQLLVVIAATVWELCFKRQAHILQVASAMLFWLAVLRLITAMGRQALPQGRFERRTEQLIATLCWILFVIWFTKLDMVVIDWLQSVDIRIGKTHLDLLTVCSAVLWVSIVIVGTLWGSRIVESRLMQLVELDQNFRIVVAKVTRTVLVIAAVLIALSIVGIDLTVLSVFTGALGVGLGFGLQKIASNYVSGFIILLDRSIRLGDRLIVENRVGHVSKITARYVVLNALDGCEILVPNDTLISNTVINQSYSDNRIWTSIAVSVAYGTNLDKVLSLLKVAARHPRVLNDPAPNAFVTGFADDGITLELGFWVKDPENGFMGLKSELFLAVWRAFEEQGIQMPFPQREIRILNDKIATILHRPPQDS